MKEDLVDYDGKTRLFKNRTAANIADSTVGVRVRLLQGRARDGGPVLPAVAQPLARMVYGKRAASTLEALARTLQRRHDHMGEKSEAEAVMDADRDFSGDEAEADEAEVVHAGSTSTRAERASREGADPPDPRAQLRVAAFEVEASDRGLLGRERDLCRATLSRRSSSASTPTRLSGSPIG